MSNTAKRYNLRQATSLILQSDSDLSSLSDCNEQDGDFESESGSIGGDSGSLGGDSVDNIELFKVAVMLQSTTCVQNISYRNSINTALQH